jgi:cellulose synthase/poly-beta-1,6-N-acetylglucosamine synthase-like glycosyltransferase
MEREKKSCILRFQNRKPGLQILLITCVIALVIQILYYLVLFSRLAFYQSSKIQTKNFSPLSIIICARNEAANLRKNLPLWLSQDYPEFEIVVVNDNSTDETFDLLREWQIKEPKLKPRNIELESKVLAGKKFALTIGLKAASNPVVIVTDSDCFPATNQWLKLMRSKLYDEKEIVIGYAPYKEGSGFLNKCIRYETFYAAIQYISFAIAGNPYMGVGRNLLYKKSLFFEHNIFVKKPELLSGDDDLFINAVANKKNTSVQIDKSSFVFSEPKKTWHEWFIQKHRHLSTAKHYKKNHQFLLGLFSFTHILFYCTLILLIIYGADWRIPLILYAMRLIFCMPVLFFNSRQLEEKDLVLWFPLFDLLILAYYFRFIPSVMKNKKAAWK